jgi:hypothetical protein
MATCEAYSNKPRRRETGLLAGMTNERLIGRDGTTNDTSRYFLDLGAVGNKSENENENENESENK